MSVKNLEEITKGYFSDIRNGLESKRSRIIMGNESASTESLDELYESVYLYKSDSVSRRLKAESSRELTAPEEYTYQNTAELRWDESEEDSDRLSGKGWRLAFWGV